MALLAAMLLFAGALSGEPEAVAEAGIAGAGMAELGDNVRAEITAEAASDAAKGAVDGPVIAPVTAPVAAMFGPPNPNQFAAQIPARVPLIGLEGPELDACISVGRVSGLGRERRKELSVYNAPDDKAEETDTLEPSALVWLCEAADEWQGIVYSNSEFQELGDCRVSGPTPEPREYNGPCQHGWVEGRFLSVVAG